MDHVFPGTAGHPGYRYISSSGTVASPSTVLVALMFSIFIMTILSGLFFHYAPTPSTPNRKPRIKNPTISLNQALTLLTQSATKTYHTLHQTTHSLIKRTRSLLTKHIKIHITIQTQPTLPLFPNHASLPPLPPSPAHDIFAAQLENAQLLLLFFEETLRRVDDDEYFAIYRAAHRRFSECGGGGLDKKKDEEEEEEEEEKRMRKRKKMVVVRKIVGGGAGLREEKTFSDELSREQSGQCSACEDESY